MKKPAFIITLDTEGDNLWENEHNITTQNTHFLPRFQQLCERFQFKPVWLTNYEMAIDEAYIEFAQDVIARNTGEIGMHLHAWNSPPLVALTDNDLHYQPYLIEYPKSQMRDKIAFMTDLLENKLQTKMLSHRAGRWAFNETYAQLLIEFGYQVDCSVTPKVDWRFTKGDPAQSGGTNYSNFPSHAYFMDVNDISKAGDSTLLEVPQKSLAQGHSHIEFMLHSSEFMPGGSPTFRTEQDIDGLYNDLETLFNFLQDKVQGMTLAEYYHNKVQAK